VRVLVDLWSPTYVVCFTPYLNVEERCVLDSVFLLSGVELSFEGAYSEDLLEVEHVISMSKIDTCLCSVSPVISSLIH